MKTIYISIDCTCIYAHICAKPDKDFQLVLYFPSFPAGCDVFPNKCHRHFVPQISCFGSHASFLFEADKYVSNFAN